MIRRDGQVFGSVLRSDAQAEPDPAESKPRTPTKAELQAQAESLGLSTEGTKAEIEARIAEASEAPTQD
jgi:hypothetical protein